MGRLAGFSTAKLCEGSVPSATYLIVPVQAAMRSGDIPSRAPR